MSNFPTGNHTQLSWVDIYKVARQAGFSAPAAVIATAITAPESGRYPGIQQSGQPYRTTGWGLWQITPGNSVPSVGTDDQLLDPLTNARAAYAKYHAAGDSFRPWTTYNNGAYKAFMASAASAASQVGDNIGGPVDSGASAGGLGGPVGTPGGLGGPVGADPTQIAQSIGSVTQAIDDLFAGGGKAASTPSAWDELGTAFKAAFGFLDQTNPVVGGFASAVQIFTDARDWLGTLVDDVDGLIKGLLWLVNPMNWVRIFAGIVGAISLVIGGVLVAGSA